jgi:hypothetical protein
MIEDIANVLTWAVCGGIPVAILLAQLFFLAQAVWQTVKR